MSERDSCSLYLLYNTLTAQQVPIRLFSFKKTVSQCLLSYLTLSVTSVSEYFQH